MNQWGNTVLTDKGAALLAKLAQGNTLNITRAVTGVGFVTPGLLTKQTEVTDPKQELTFQAVTYPESGKCAIPVSLKNDALEAGYEVTQVGLYAADPDEGELLLIISQAPDADSGTIVPSATEMPGYSAEWTFYLQYGQADGVTVTVDPTNTVTKESMDAYVRTRITIHNTDSAAHSDLREALQGLSYSKVSVSNIVDNLITNVATKPLSAAQGVALKTLIDTLRDAVNGKASESHIQAASTITSGTLAGQVKANATAAATIGTAQVRNIYAGTEDMTPGSSQLATGVLYFVYE